jgi:hypothetical protein
MATLDYGSKVTAVWYCDYPDFAEKKNSLFYGKGCHKRSMLNFKCLNLTFMLGGVSLRDLELNNCSSAGYPAIRLEVDVATFIETMDVGRRMACLKRMIERMGRLRCIVSVNLYH